MLRAPSSESRPGEAAIFSPEPPENPDFEPETLNLELPLGTTFAQWMPGRTGVARIEKKEEHTVLWTIFVILLILWLLGLVSGYTIGGFIHILLVIAVVVLIIRLIQGRSVV